MARFSLNGRVVLVTGKWHLFRGQGFNYILTKYQVVAVVLAWHCRSAV